MIGIRDISDCTRVNISVRVRAIEYEGECVLGSIPHGGIRTGTAGRGVTSFGIRADLSPVRCASEDAGLPLGGVDDPAEPSRSRGKIPPGAVAVERCVRLRATLV